MNGRIPTGAEKLIQCLEREGVEYVFGLSGGAAMPLFDALVDSKIRLILTRHEQGATHMADGYARATGRPGVVLVTSGPGSDQHRDGPAHGTDGLGPGHRARRPADHARMLGKDAFQEADVSGITYPVVKHSYLVKDADEIPARGARGLPPGQHRPPRTGPDRPAQGRDAGALRTPRSSTTSTSPATRCRDPRRRGRDRRGGRAAEGGQATAPLRGPRRGHLGRRQGRGDPRGEAPGPHRQHPARQGSRRRDAPACTSACWACTARPTRTRRWSTAT